MVKTQPSKDKQIAAAFLLSYPQLFVWAVVFALIGGFTVWTTGAFSGNSNTATGSIALRMVNDNNGDGQPNWGDTVTFDVSAPASTNPILKLSCYQNGNSVYYAQRDYSSANAAAVSQYIELKSAQWPSGQADCVAALVKTSSSKQTTLNSYSFHVNA